MSGDRVKVQLEVEIFKMMQEGHGGWNDQMTEVRGRAPYVALDPLLIIV